MQPQRRLAGLALICVAALALLSGCESGGHFSLLGYTTQPPIHDDVRTIYVPMAQNTTYLIDIEKLLTRAVVQEIGTSGYRLTSDRCKADTELLMTVVANRKNVILFNPLGETREAELGFFVQVIWRDLRPGHEGNILSNPKAFDPSVLPLPGEAKALPPPAIPLQIAPTATFVPELGGSAFSAHQLAANKAARQIVNMMEVWR